MDKEAYHLSTTAVYLHKNYYHLKWPVLDVYTDILLGVQTVRLKEVPARMGSQTPCIWMAVFAMAMNMFFIQY